MWFKNLQIYRITDWKLTHGELEELLARRTLEACLSMEMQSQGWVPPGMEEEHLVYVRGQQMLIALGSERKLLPASVVNQRAKARAEEMEVQQGYPVGRKQMKEIKEAALYELLPRAFVIRQKSHAWIDPVDGWFIIDSANVARGFDKGAVLVSAANYMVHASHRESDGIAEIHTLDTDIIYVLEGGATLVTGGGVPEARPTEPNELRGPRIVGGESRRVSKGDVIVVPAGVPHMFTDVAEPLNYYVVKVR